MGFEDAFKKNIDMVRNDAMAADAVASQKRLEELSERLSALARKAEAGEQLTDQELAEQGLLIAEMEKQARLKANSSNVA